MSQSVDLSEMQVYVAVVTEQSFTAAATRLETDKARVSRIVQRIEEKLGARLLNRSTRRLSVTEVGRDYFERVSSILRAAEAAEAAVAQRSEEPRGRLKIAATPEFGTTRVDGWIAAYLSTWPKVTVETVYSIRFVDVVHEGIDVAIRLGTLPGSGSRSSLATSPRRTWRRAGSPASCRGGRALPCRCTRSSRRRVTWTRRSARSSISVATRSGTTTPSSRSSARSASSRGRRRRGPSAPGSGSR